MANIFESKDRRVIPNWRSFKVTSMLGELDKNIVQKNELDLSTSLASYVDDFLLSPSPAIAGDLLSAALVNGLFTDENAIKAANFIINNQQKSTKTQISLAERVLNESKTEKNFKLDSLSVDDIRECVNPKLVWKKINDLKQSSKLYSFNPIVWIELARQYSIIGQKEKAFKAMKIALQLDPLNRFVLRSAVRLFVHFDELEISHDIVRKSLLTNFDPWLTSAEISLATLRNRTSRFMKKGNEMITSNNFSPFSITELSSSLGTVELMNGNTKKSRNLFKKSLLSPNDNSLAQIEWASKTDNSLIIDPSTFNVEHNFEAKALANFQNNNHTEALNNTFKWFLDMPFSKRPVMLGSHIAGTLLNNQETSREFLKAGLISHPNDPQLINNIVYSLAVENKTQEAMDYLEKVNTSAPMEETTAICLMATRGLIYFRTGFYDVGRNLYLGAISEAKEIQNEYFNWLAILNYVREEILIKAENVDTLMETVDLNPDSTKYNDIKKLKKEVIEAYKELKESLN